MKKLCLKYGAIWLSLFALFLFSFIVGKQSNAEIATSSVVFYYDFDSDSNHTYLQQYYNPGTWNMTDFDNGATSVATSTGVWGNGIYSPDNSASSAASSAYIYAQNYYLGGPYNWKTPSEFAYSFWIKSSNTPAAQQIFFTSVNSFSLRWLADGTFRLDYKNSAGSWQDTDCAGFFSPDGNWRNVIVQGTQGGTADFYLDGFKICDNVSMGTLGDYYDNGVVLGFMSNIISSLNGDYWGATAWGIPGYLDDFALFNRELTPTEITALQIQSVNEYITNGDAVVNNNTIYAFGWPNLWSNPSVFQPNSGVKQFPIFWDACSSYGDLDHASVVPVFNGSGYHPGTAVIDPKASVIGPQECKGNFIYYDTFDTTTSGYVDFNLLFYDISGNVIATTTSNRVSYTTATSSGTFISNIDSDPLNIDLGNLPEYGQTESTTTLSFMYNFIGENAASTTVYLWDYQNNTSTGFIYNGPFISTSTSWASIEIPTPDINTYKTYKFIAVRPGYSNLVSSLFGVNWNFTPIPLKPECKPPNYDITRICDGLATGPLPDYILGDLLCGVKYGLVAAGQFMYQPNCDSLDYITDNYNLFKGSFPFNTYFDLTDSINTAIDTATTSTSTLNAFSIPFIRKTSTSSEYYMMPVMNATSVSQSIGNTNYNIYKTTLGYIWWLLGALIIYITIRKV